MKHTFLILATLLLLTGCAQQPPEKAFWSGHLQRTDGKAIPFRAYVDLETAPPTGYFLTGPERTPIPEIVRHGDSLSFLFSEYNAAMLGRVSGTTWQGNYQRYRNATTSVPFTATVEPSSGGNKAEGNKPAIPLVGKFQAFVSQGRKTDSNTVGTFWTKNDSIFGTLIAPDGDYGLNVGTQEGTTVTLSRFTGWQAQLFEFSQAGTTWKGTYYVRDDSPASILLEPRNVLPAGMPGTRVTAMNKRNARFVFSGLTPEGDTLSDRSDQFKGKALIVDIMGTWCHNCMDESPVFQQVYSEFREKGLEIVGLSFEINDNAIQAAKNLTLYRQRYGITYPVLFCGSTDDKYVGPQLRAQLANFYAYPTALFIDKKGRVHSIHIGFKGPGTGEEFQAEVNHIYDEVKAITGSPTTRK